MIPFHDAMVFPSTDVYWARIDALEAYRIVDTTVKADEAWREYIDNLPNL